MRMYIGSILVNDVAHAHDFYVGTLGFQVKDDVTHGDFRWLTITTPTQLAEDGSVLPGAGMEIVLEPKGHPIHRGTAVGRDSADAVPHRIPGPGLRGA